MKTENIINLVTEQQEYGFEAYGKYVEEMKGVDLPAINFLEYYSLLCEEEGLFNDSSSEDI